MKLTGFYVWSVRVTVEVPDNATEEEQRDALDDATMKAEQDALSIPPVLFDCSNENLID
jgi:hypothetical protein